MKPAHNSTLAIGGVPSPLDSFEVAESSVLRTNFCAEKPATTPSPKTWCVLNHPHSTKVGCDECWIIHGSPSDGIDLPQRAVKSTLQTALCCNWGNSFVVSDKVRNENNDSRRCSRQSWINWTHYEASKRQEDVKINLSRLGWDKA